ncbi:hypothetical protein [Bdellovibrio sp. HCB337]|uniref:hypothetical protein n=1 Tax=Bdellovibrio sp. HCB337 TaxID=3394358 RepID=UPI0039A503D4
MVRTIKFFQMLLILSSIVFGTAAMAVSEQNYEQFSCSAPTGGAGGGDGGGDIIWPWDFAVKFPWENVQGVWRAEKDGKILYYMFRRVQAKRIKIRQIDVETCEVIGTGQGYETAKTVIAAQIMDTVTRESYNFTLYAFNEEDSPEPPISSKAGTEQVIVVRIYPLFSSEPEFAAQMVRISDRLELTCGPNEKKIKF